MFVERMQVSGLRDATSEPTYFERVQVVAGEWPALRALRDAMLVPFCLVDEIALRALLAGWGAEDVQIEVDGLVGAATWRRGEALHGVLDPDADGLLRVSVGLQLDPPQFAQLKRAALRDPRLVDALAGGAQLELSVGLRFAPGRDRLAVDPLSVSLGGMGFVAQGPDRPPWLVPFLRGLQGRCVGAPTGPASWGEFAGNWSPGAQRDLQGALAALSSSPLRLVNFLPLPGEPARFDGTTLTALRLLAPRDREAIGWVGAARLGRPDVLVALGARVSPAWLRWWRTQVEGEQAPLEQVLLLEESRGRRT